MHYFHLSFNWRGDNTKNVVEFFIGIYDIMLIALFHYSRDIATIYLNILGRDENYIIMSSILKYLRVAVVWSYGSWIYNYLCIQCLSPLMLSVWISIRERCTPLCDTVCQWLATDRWFSLSPPISSTNKTDSHNITEILLKVELNATKQANLNYLPHLKFQQ